MATNGLDLSRHFREIEAATRARTDARAKLDGREMSDGERTTLESKLKRAGEQIERAAGLINAELSRAAREGLRVSSVPREIHQLRDPEVQTFCSSVDVAIRRLNECLETTSEKLETQQRLAIDARKNDAARIGDRIRQNKAHYAKELAALGKQEEELKKGREKADRNLADVAKQLEKLEEDRAKLKRELKKVEDVVATRKREAAELERERKSLVLRLRAERKREVYSRLERRVLQIDQHLKKLDRFLREDVGKQQAQLRKLEARLLEEVEEMKAAKKRLGLEKEKLDAEHARLAETRKRLEDAIEKDEAREDKVDEAVKKLVAAEKKPPKRRVVV